MSVTCLPMGYPSTPGCCQLYSQQLLLLTAVVGLCRGPSQRRHTSSHLAVSPFTRSSLRMTITSRWRLAAMRIGLLLSTGWIFVITGGGAVYRMACLCVTRGALDWDMVYVKHRKTTLTKMQYKSYGGMIKSAIFSWWILLLSWRLTNSLARNYAHDLPWILQYPDHCVLMVHDLVEIDLEV